MIIPKEFGADFFELIGLETSPQKQSPLGSLEPGLPAVILQKSHKSLRAW